METQGTSTDTILIVDDDESLSELVSRFLTDNGFSVSCESSGTRAIERITEEAPSLVVLDLMLPGTDGLSVCRAVRDRYHGPIIMLTALNDEIDEVTGLEVGADDYLAKPVKPRVLLAHIRAQLRRQGLAIQSADGKTVPCFNSDVIISASQRTVKRGGNEITLTSAEFDLLWLLAKQVGEVISREQLHNKIFNLPFDGVDRSIDLRISRIRRKLGDDPKDPQIIKTVRNVGYLLAS